LSSQARGLDKRAPSDRGKGTAPGHSNIDHLDQRILRRLLTHGRSSYRRIAAELSVSTTTVAGRVAQMEQSGLIKGYTGLLDYEKLGYEITAVTEIMVSKGKLVEMEEEIARLPGVCAVYDVTGEIDGIVVAKFRTREELSHFTKGLLSLRFVDRANTHVVLTTMKEDFRLPV